MKEWPVTLPIYPLVEGYAEVLADNLLRTEMDQGPDKVRLRSTAGVTQLQLRFLITKAQATILEEFFTETLSSGADKFLYNHPRRDENVECRFLQPPEFEAVNNNYFRVSAVLEILP